MAENPLQTIIDEDSELFNLLQDSYKLAFAEGKIPVKYKILIAMSLDAAHGAVDGVKALAKQAMQAGATKEEVIEAIRVTYYICGAGGAYPASIALKEIF